MTGRRRDARLDESIRREAAALLDEVGHAAFTVEEVARRAGVHKSTIYTRWPSRTHLLADMVAQAVAGAGDARPASDARQRLLALIERDLRMSRSRAGRAAMQIALAALDDPAHQTLAAPLLIAIRARRNLYEEAISALDLQRFSGTGVVRTAATLVAATVWASGIIAAADPTQQPRAEHIVEALIAQYS